LLDTATVVGSAGVVCLFLVAFLPLPAAASWSYLLGSALVHEAYFALIALSYHAGDLSLVYPVMRGTAPALTAMGSLAFLAERPRPTGWAGILLICGGVLLLARRTHREQSHPTRAIVLALSNAAVIAAYTVLDGTGVRLSKHTLSYTAWGFILAAALFVPVVMWMRRGQGIAHLRKRWAQGTFGGICSIAAYAIALWAMTQAPIATVAALRETSVVFGTLIGVVALKERITPTRALAVCLVMAGAIVIRF
jgi:drug/metabolite transporter (DMT)-like permease